MTGHERSTSFRRTLATGLAVGVTAIALAACGSDGPSTAAPAEAAPTTSAPTVLGADLAGRWAHYDVVAYEDDTMKTLIISYGFTDFEVVDGELVESETFCHADQASDQAIETSISDAATQAIVPVSTPVEVTEVDGELRVRRPATPTPVGIHLEDPANDPLPTDPADPRIADDDGDGNPGITVHVRVGDVFEGDLFLARREIFAYDLITDGPDSLVGSVIDSSEQLVIGATDPLLTTTSAQWVQHPDPARSPVLLVRVTPDHDCSRLMAERDSLFPPDPSPDW